MKKRATAGQLIELLPAEKLSQLAEETNVDWQVKKLWGTTMFKLILMSILQSNRVSLRVMAEIYQSPKFRVMNGLPKEVKTSYSSLSDRIAAMNPKYFEALFNSCHELLGSRYEQRTISRKLIHRYDSTVISASAKLLQVGMVNGLKNKLGEHSIKQVKLTVGFSGLFSNKADMYTEQRHLGEDITLRETIISSRFDKDSIVVFDRGIKRRKTFEEFCEKEILFVTRINPTVKHEVVKDYCSCESLTTATLRINSDQWVHLYQRASMKIETPLRLIKAINIVTEEPIFFLTNISDLGTEAITEIYKRRWDIEVFFRFLKQELNLKHLMSYNENGIKIMMYMTLIAAMLVMAYKKENNLSGYKIPMMKFIQDIEGDFIKQIVAFCGGDPKRINKLYPT